MRDHLPIERRDAAGTRGPSRVGHALRKHGVVGGAKVAWSKVSYVARAAWRRAFMNRHAVFRLVGTDSAPFNPTPRLQVERFGSLEAIPAALVDRLRADRGEAFLPTLKEEMVLGAVLWVGLLDGRIAGTSLSRAGRHFRKWYMPLGADDVVIFANVTLEEFRGRGVCPTIMRRICAEELPAGASAYVDCKVWNVASIRSILRAGFQEIARVRAETRRDHLG